MPDPAPAWRCVLAPGGKLSVLSDIVPGPRLGQPGELERWQEVTDPPLWTGFADACEIAAKWNGKVSTVGMGAREAETQSDAIETQSVGGGVVLENVQAILDYLMAKNADLMRRLARGPRDAAGGGGAT